ncbi:glycosyltransferase family 4 protein [Vibrio fluvialis]|nr:glycosyltransferase family 4 protein [Vibrio fluvialis]
MSKSVFIFHDSNVSSGATAALLDLFSEIFKLKGRLNYIAIIPKYGDNNSLRARLEAYGVTVGTYNVPMTRVKYKAPCISLILSYSSAVFNIFTSFFESKKVACFLKNKNIGLVYTNTTSTYLGLFVAKSLRCRHICHVREFGKEDQNMTQVFGEAFFYNILQSMSDKIIVISKALEQKLTKYISSDKIELIYDDVDVKSKQDYRLIFQDSKHIRLLITGTICRGKGQKFIVLALSKAIEKYPEIKFELNIAGDDNTSYAKDLKVYVEQLKISDHVNFLGHCSDMGQVRLCNDIAVVASSSEAFGRVTIEAMSSSLLVLASDQGANVELVNHKDTGLLYKHNDIDSFIESLDYALKSVDSSRRVAMRGFQHSQRYTCGVAAQRVLAIVS